MDERSYPIADRVVRSAARGVTRRRFMRNAGAGALGLSLAAALGDLKLGRSAYAVGTSRRPCGPSPLCPSKRCYGGQCSNAPGRVYNSYRCRPRRGGGCWTEDYRHVGRGRWRCCDCCAVDGGGARCSSCGDNRRRRACICRKRTG